MRASCRGASRCTRPMACVTLDSSPIPNRFAHPPPTGRRVPAQPPRQNRLYPSAPFLEHEQRNPNLAAHPATATGQRARPPEPPAPRAAGGLRDDEVVPPFRVNLPEGPEAAQLGLQRAPFALVGVHRLAPARHHEVHLALLVIAPEQDFSGVLHTQERVQHQMSGSATAWAARGESQLT